MSDIESKIKELALLDTAKLMQYVDLEKFEICEMRKTGKSYQQIAIKTGKNRSKVQRICRVCI